MAESRKVFLTHHDGDDGGKEAHWDRLRDVEAEEGREVVCFVFLYHNIVI